jgi:DNA-binding MarR family transcriptional regulator
MSNHRRAERFAALILEMRQFIAGTVLYNQGVAERLGIHATDLQCLGVLDSLGPVTPGKLAAWTGLTTGGVTVMLDRLEKSGFIRRQRNPNDRRSVLVEAVAAQKKKLFAPYEAIQKEMARMVSIYSDAQLDTIIDFFERSNAMQVDATGAVTVLEAGKNRDSARGREPVHDTKKNRDLGRLPGKAGHPSARRRDA